jgi:hypothetical protein
MCHGHAHMLFSGRIDVYRLLSRAVCAYPGLSGTLDCSSALGRHIVSNTFQERRELKGFEQILWKQSRGQFSCRRSICCH